MKLTRGALATVWSALAVTALAGQGCTDVGDSSAVPGGGDATLAPEDGGASGSDGGASTGSSEAAASSEGGLDATIAPDAPASASPDTGVPSPDSGASDPAGADATVADAQVEDTGAKDAGTADAGTGDDTGVVSPPDGGAVDAGRDAATIDAGALLVPCTTAGQTSCVQCQYNNGAAGTLPNASSVCTPTEAALVRYDIAAGTAASAGPDPSGSCYACAALSGCLDDSEFNDQGHECEDLSASGAPAECEATLACILQTSCGSGSGALSTCYCGTAPVSGSCAAIGASNAANGGCKASEASGLGFSPDDGLDILKNFTSTTLPAGVANNVFQCASSNGCTACLQ